MLTNKNSNNNNQNSKGNSKNNCKCSDRRDKYLKCYLLLVVACVALWPQHGIQSTPIEMRRNAISTINTSSNSSDSAHSRFGCQHDSIAGLIRSSPVILKALGAHIFTGDVWDLSDASLLITLTPETIYKGASLLKLATKATMHNGGGSGNGDVDSDSAMQYEGQLNATLEPLACFDGNMLKMLPTVLIAFGKLVTVQQDEQEKQALQQQQQQQQQQQLQQQPEQQYELNEKQLMLSPQLMQDLTAEQQQQHQYKLPHQHRLNQLQHQQQQQQQQQLLRQQQLQRQQQQLPQAQHEQQMREQSEDILRISINGLHRWTPQFEAHIWKHLGWDDWSDFTLCSVTCGKGVQQRFRRCLLDNPMMNFHMNMRFNEEEEVDDDDNNEDDDDGTGADVNVVNNHHEEMNIFRNMVDVRIEAEDDSNMQQWRIGDEHAKTDENANLANAIRSIEHNMENVNGSSTPKGVNNNNDNDNENENEKVVDAYRAGDDGAVGDDDGDERNTKNVFNQKSYAGKRKQQQQRQSKSGMATTKTQTTPATGTMTPTTTIATATATTTTTMTTTTTTTSKTTKRKKKKSLSTIFCEGFNIEQRNCNSFECNDDISDLLKFYKRWPTFEENVAAQTPFDYNTAADAAAISSSQLPKTAAIDNVSMVIVNSNASSTSSASVSGGGVSKIESLLSMSSSTPANMGYIKMWHNALNFTLMLTIRINKDESPPTATIFSIRNSTNNLYLESCKDGLRLYLERDNTTEMLPVKFNLFDYRWHQVAISIQNGDFISIYIDCSWTNSFVVSKRLFTLPLDAEVEIGRGFNGELQQLLVLPDNQERHQCSNKRTSINEVKRYIIDTFIDDYTN